MLEIPDSFFEAQVRHGFLVSEEMKRAWAAEMKVLDMLMEFCNKNGLRCFAEYGTLLGAVRHKGFIPWDDDIDVCMLRPDFNFLLEHADELPPSIRIQSIYSSNMFHTFKALATNNLGGKLTYSKERMEEFYGCPYVVGLDIYPLDYVPRDPGNAKMQKLIYQLAYKMLYMCIDLENIYDKNINSTTDNNISLLDLAGSDAIEVSKKQEFLTGITSLADILKRYFGNSFVLNERGPIRNQLCRLCEALAQLFDESESDTVSYYPYIATDNISSWRKKQWYEDTLFYPFECMNVLGVRNYDEWLSHNYGPEWFRPVKGTQVHDYPFYKSQKEYFEMIGAM